MDLNHILKQFAGGGGYWVCKRFETIALNMCKDKNPYVI